MPRNQNTTNQAQTNAQRQAAYRNRQKAAGICAECKTNPIDGDSDRCADCKADRRVEPKITDQQWHSVTIRAENVHLLQYQAVLAELGKVTHFQVPVDSDMDRIRWGVEGCKMLSMFRDDPGQLAFDRDIGQVNCPRCLFRYDLTHGTQVQVDGKDRATVGLYVEEWHNRYGDDGNAVKGPEYIIGMAA